MKLLLQIITILHGDKFPPCKSTRVIGERVVREIPSKEMGFDFLNYIVSAFFFKAMVY